MKNRILIVSPHPDDETLGAGGSLLRFKAEGDSIYWLNMTDMKEEYGFSAKDVLRRTTEIDKVRKSYAFDGFYNLGLRPSFLSQYSPSDIMGQVKKVLDQVKPSIVILPFKEDAHSDHKIVFETVSSCLKVFRAPFVKEILVMEILSETDFSTSKNGFMPNYFVDISGYLEKKILIAKNYKSEFGKHPFPRSFSNIRALSLLRGAVAGCESAEGFMLVKMIR